MYVYIYIYIYPVIESSSKHTGPSLGIDREFVLVYGTLRSNEFKPPRGSRGVEGRCGSRAVEDQTTLLVASWISIISRCVVQNNANWV